MTLLQDRPADHDVEPRSSWIVRRLGPAWPLKALLVGFPLWWALGLGSVACLFAAVVMALQIVRSETLRLPKGFGLWLLFLVWVALGVLLLWTDAPGTVGGGGPERLILYGYRCLWYLAVTVAMLYPLTFRRDQLPSIEVIRWLALLFVYCVVGGLAGLVVPGFEFSSLPEILVPGVRGNDFLYTLVHPSLTTSSEFLGYEQGRPKAPFAYTNTWGNVIGILVPFFVYALWVAERRWLRLLIPLGLGLAALPMAYSLNRGLWLGLAVMTVCGCVALARMRQYAALWGVTAGVVVAGIALVLSPVWATISLRAETPHSNERRLTVADVVTRTTWEGSPLLGYGTTRRVQGSFSSIAGGGNPNCRQCAAPPLGTQGFMWRLVFTTGFVGTGLAVLFLLVQFFGHWAMRNAVVLLGCMTIVTSSLFFFVYDSLETPLFLLFLVLGLMNRERLLVHGESVVRRLEAVLDPSASESHS